MAEAARSSLKTSLTNAVSAVGNAVEGTTEIANIAVQKATGITKSTVNAAGVLGEGAVNASSEIGSAALGATSQVGTTAITQGADVAANALTASATITNAATKAAADIATTALDTGASTVNVTTEKVGEALRAGVNLAGNTVSRAANGLDNIGAIVAGRGAIVVKGKLQKQAAESAAIDAREMTTRKTELLKAFQDVESLVTSALSTLHGVQKTALAGKINIYKRAKCGFFTRMTGFCDAGTISNDMKKTDFFLDEFKSSIRKASEDAKTAITNTSGDTTEAFRTIEIAYMTAVKRAVDTFVNNYAVLIAKYDELAKKALGITGGRRKKTLRKKKVKRASSRKRPSVRARFA